MLSSVTVEYQLFYARLITLGLGRYYDSSRLMANTRYSPDKKPFSEKSYN